MSNKIRLTMAQALVRWLAAQKTRLDGPTDGKPASLFAGMFAIFGHGNVAGMGEALQGRHNELPVYRAHNEQGMAHAAIAYAKAMRRRRMMACTTSVGPGATNMVTAAALAHVNRLPVLLLPGDTFASRLPDPVLQQVENFSDPTITANDCFRPVSRYWDRITRPEQLLQSLPQALAVLLDPVDCGPVTLALPQDVQAEAWDYPVDFFAEQVHCLERAGADPSHLKAAAERIRKARRPLIVAGGGVHYSGACAELASFAERLQIPVAETQAGKGALPWDHPNNVGAIGVTGSSAANELAHDADLVIAIGTRLQDFTTGSGLLLGNHDAALLSINVARHDLVKRSAQRVQGDARRSLQELGAQLENSTTDPAWVQRFRQLRLDWIQAVDAAMVESASELPSDAEVLGCVNKVFSSNATVVCAAGGLPGELHKLWRSADADSYHLEYGYSCMGYEIAGGLGVKMALPERDVVVMVGDGSYLMMNSEIATSVALGQKLVIVVLDNRGFGCINRLQTSLGGTGYNNLWDSSYPQTPHIDFAAHAASLGARSEKLAGLDELPAALQRAREAGITSVVVIDTDPVATTAAGGTWWDVPVAEVSEHEAVRQAASNYQEQQKKR
ncbi:MAG TPA: 3D-(3,5/4)-trihydroxycyclohexane-1,2-dione acylhydrolase (decyclizing) [Xanthomonadales bacterium]|nr:3D-(3,5/4)-trihydroxycyclohexane-1,2-dione acylhydrolase (decyclizing) [Xanthomonadales bacterium]